MCCLRVEFRIEVRSTLFRMSLTKLRYLDNFRNNQHNFMNSRNSCGNHGVQNMQLRKSQSQRNCNPWRKRFQRNRVKHIPESLHLRSTTVWKERRRRVQLQYVLVGVSTLRFDLPRRYPATAGNTAGR